jgi:hypothetical protein
MLRPLLMVCLVLGACQVEDAASLSAIDRAPLPQPMTLDVTTPLRQGAPVQFEVRGATPGATVVIVRSDGGIGAGDCPPVLGGQCLDIRPGTTGYIVTLSLRADAGGVATWSGTVPMAARVGGTVAFQAVDPALDVGSNAVVRVVQPACQDDATEPDNSYRDATPVSAPSATVDAWSCPGNGDWYAVSVSAGEVLSASASFDPNEMNLDLLIADPSGQTVVDSTFVLVAPEYASTVATVSGTWYVAVFPRTTGQRAGAAYQVVVDVDSPGVCAPDALEPNNLGATQARAVGVGRWDDLSTCTTNDYDWYRVDLVAGQTAQLDVLFDNNEGDIDAWLLSAPTANDVNVFDQQYLARGITADNDENLTFTAAVTGSYYLVVKMYRDGGAAQVGNLYDLVVGVQ